VLSDLRRRADEDLPLKGLVGEFHHPDVLGCLGGLDLPRVTATAPMTRSAASL